MKITKYVTLILLPLFLAACSAEANLATNSITIDDLQKEWALVEVDGEKLGKEISGSLTIDQEAKATGNLACNRFFGTAQLQGNSLKIDKMGSTRRMCEPLVDQVEAIVSQVLSSDSTVTIKANKLLLNSAEHQLTYQIAP